MRHSNSSDRPARTAPGCPALSIAICLAIALWCEIAAAQPLEVLHRSTVALPSATTDQNGAGFTIAGLSGIAYSGPAAVPGVHGFIAVLDNSNKVIRIEAQIADNGSISSAVVVGGLSLAQSADFEDIVIAADGASVMLSEEGAPGVRRFALSDGSFIGTLAVPQVFLSRRDNFGFEALADGGGRLWTANEEALTVDGPTASPTAGTLVRLLRFDESNGTFTATAQHAYRCEPLHGSIISGARSGLVALVVLPSGRMLALERSFAFNLGGFFRSRLFEVDLAVASDVSALPALEGAAHSPAGKGLLWAGGHNNLEGLCLGPALPGGGRVLIGVVDDGDPISTNALISFQMTGPTEAECPADADGSGDVGVPDIFRFLSWWFASDPRADVDGTAGIGVPDIFIYLSRWFIGCP